MTSPYGAGSTVADGSGHWYVQVFFPAAPEGETFTVTISDGVSSTSFPFVAT